MQPDSLVKTFYIDGSVRPKEGNWAPHTGSGFSRKGCRHPQVPSECFILFYNLLPAVISFHETGSADAISVPAACK
jgi:hypothetical protein